MLKINVSTGLVSKAHSLIANSNKLTSTLKISGKGFIINAKDLPTIEKILTRNYINFTLN